MTRLETVLKQYFHCLDLDGYYLGLDDLCLRLGLVSQNQHSSRQLTADETHYSRLTLITSSTVSIV